MANFTFLVLARPAVCARALLVFLLACPCSVFFNAGRSFENSFQRVLIMLVLSCCGNGNELEARATPVEDRRPEFKSGQTLVWFHPPTPAVGHRLVHVNGRICFGSATPTCMGNHESLEAGRVLVEVKWKWMWMR